MPTLPYPSPSLVIWTNLTLELPPPALGPNTRGWAVPLLVKTVRAMAKLFEGQLHTGMVTVEQVQAMYRVWPLETGCHCGNRRIFIGPDDLPLASVPTSCHYLDHYHLRWVPFGTMSQLPPFNPFAPPSDPSDPSDPNR